MQKTTSQKALKVISIIMIVFAALTLLLGIGGIVTGGALGILGAGSGDAGSAALVGGVAAVAGFVILLGGAINLAIGIFGLRGANDPRKIGAFYVLAIIGLAFAVLSALGTFFGGSADGGDIASALFGLVLPLVCVLLAYNIKKENHLERPTGSFPHVKEGARRRAPSLCEAVSGESNPSARASPSARATDRSPTSSRS